MTTHCTCGERLLLTRPGDTCERCRLGRGRQTKRVDPPRPELRETCDGCGAFTACADGLCLGCRLTPAVPERRAGDLEGAKR